MKGRENMTAIYKDPSFSATERVEDLLKRMSLEEKIGQMMQANGNDKDNPPEKLIKEKNIGTFLHVIGDRCSKYQEITRETRLGIPVLFAIDAIHGHGFYHGAVIFPTQIGMSCSWDPEIIEKAARITAIEVVLTGV